MKNDNQDYGQALAQWNFQEYDQPERSKLWYFWAVAIVIALLIYSLFTLNFLFAVIIVLSFIIILMKDHYQPKQIIFVMAEDGLLLDGKFFNFEEIKDFYILYKPEEIKNIYFNFKSWLKPRLVIPLQNQDPVEIRNILKQYLEENLEKEEEPVSEVFKRIFKI